MLHSQADPGARRLCQIWRESVQWVTTGGDKPDFWPVSKFNNGRTRNKSLISKAMQYRQDIVTRMPITRVQLITIWIATILRIWHNSAAKEKKLKNSSKLVYKRQRNVCLNYAPLERTVLRTRSVTKKKQKTNATFSHIQPVRVVRSSPNFTRW